MIPQGVFKNVFKNSFLEFSHVFSSDSSKKLLEISPAAVISLRISSGIGP